MSVTGRRDALLVGAALAALAGCRPVHSLEIAVTLPEDVDVEAYDFRTSIYAPGAEATLGGSCQDFWWGAHDLTELAAALVGSRPSVDDVGIPDVPRDGQKLVVVEGFGQRSQKRALLGCSPLGGIEGEVVVDVVMERTARLELTTTTGELAARVPYGGKSALRPLPDVWAFDDEGAPLSGAPVRVWLTGAEGEVVADLGADEELLTDEAGHLSLDMLEVESFGAFQVRARPKLLEGEGSPNLEGFAIPLETAVEPFGPGADMRQVLPVPVGPAGIGFVGLERTGVTSTLRFALPSGAEGLPSFSVVDPPGLIGTGFRVFAVVHDPVAEEGVVLALAAGGALWAVTPDDARFLLPGTTPIGEDASGMEVTLADVAAGGFETALTVLPVGPCSVDPLAGPLLVLANLGRAEDRTEVVAFALDPLQAQPNLVPLNAGGGALLRNAFRSLCLADDEGEVRRVLVARNLRGGFTVVDLGDSVPELNGSVLPFEDFTVPGATALGATAGEAPSLLVGSVSGFSIQVNELRLSSGGSVLGEPAYLYGLPGPPRLLGSGAFTGPLRREDYHLLSVGSGDEEDLTPGLLYFVTEAGAGGVELLACRPAKACLVYPGDVDGDGVDELFVGRLVPYGDGFDGERVMAEVVRLSQ